MKIGIHLTPEGHTQVAKGQTPYSWHLLTTLPDSDGVISRSDGYTLVGTVELNFPRPEEAVHIALELLRKKEKELHLETHDKLQAIQEERAKLMSIGYEQVPEAVVAYHTADNDITDV